MDFVYVTLAICAALFIYQMYFRQDDDDLDRHGHRRKK